MLSIARVRSTRGAAGYFAADNYYASGDDAAAGEWFGKGADALGLSGQVEHGAFEAVLSGILPGGARVGSDARHAAGTDLTFSLPKSWSLLALVGGDRRISDAYLASVKDTLSWAERNAAETRLERRQSPRKPKLKARSHPWVPPAQTVAVAEVDYSRTLTPFDVEVWPVTP